MFRVVGAAILGVALVLNVVGVATSAWIVRVRVIPGFDNSFGIFTGYVTDTVAAVFNILADLLLIAAITCAVASHLKKTEETKGIVGGILGILAGVLIVVGVGHYTRNYHGLITVGRTAAWGYSFALCWASFVLALLGGGLAMIAK